MMNLLGAFLLSLLFLASGAEAPSWSAWVELDGPMSVMPLKSGDISSIDFSPTDNDCEAEMVIHLAGGSKFTVPMDVFARPFEYRLGDGEEVEARCDYRDVSIRVKGLSLPQPRSHA